MSKDMTVETAAQAAQNDATASAGRMIAEAYDKAMREAAKGALAPMSFAPLHEGKAKDMTAASAEAALTRAVLDAARMTAAAAGMTAARILAVFAVNGVRYAGLCKLHAQAALDDDASAKLGARVRKLTGYQEARASIRRAYLAAGQDERSGDKAIVRLVQTDPEVKAALREREARKALDKRKDDKPTGEGEGAGGTGKGADGALPTLDLPSAFVEAAKLGATFKPDTARGKACAAVWAACATLDAEGRRAVLAHACALAFGWSGALDI